MKPELILSGPAQRGEVNVYVGIDGRKHYFDPKTEAALGSQLRPKERIRNPYEADSPRRVRSRAERGDPKLRPIGRDAGQGDSPVKAALLWQRHTM